MFKGISILESVLLILLFIGFTESQQVQNTQIINSPGDSNNVYNTINSPGDSNNVYNTINSPGDSNNVYNTINSPGDSNNVYNTINNSGDSNNVYNTINSPSDSNTVNTVNNNIYDNINNLNDLNLFSNLNGTIKYIVDNPNDSNTQNNTIDNNELNDTFYYGYTNFTLKDIKIMNVTMLDEFVTTCPEYSRGPRTVYSYFNNTSYTLCDVTFACNTKTCIYYKSNYAPYLVKSQMQYGMSFINEKNPNQRLIIHSCISGDENCNSNGSCTTNDECFSGKCNDGRCIVRNEKPISLCQIQRRKDDFSIGCAQNINEKCQQNSDCLSGNCNQYRSICFDSKVKYQAPFINNNFFIFMGFIMLILLSFVLYVYTLKDKLCHRNQEGIEEELDFETASENSSRITSPDVSQSQSSISDTNENFTHHHITIPSSSH
ncbi:hypothetical protein BCR36DRAFT_342868 [Piromyces finnis]|uniref:Uncharacterized protein n=1 Tax=Piromyces finnis TaxID=1754191 RepID=A0A1Y1VKW8_9FUNG|nr:hypothetical protein BCR36DRAFT_342868 [Piromyces finnis]|eukprot:ORX59111.1 hypothetical protein BCR36DRAFT_342868 [Piromyces finnis]